jgi:CBS domain-containing protein
MQHPLTAPRTTTVAEAARMMKDRGVSAVMVVDGDKLAGIFTERDALFRVIADGRNPKSTPVEAMMTAKPQVIGPDRPLLQALILMHEVGFRHAPVVSGGHPVDLVLARDALSLEWREFEGELEHREQIGKVLG